MSLASVAGDKTGSESGLPETRNLIPTKRKAAPLLGPPSQKRHRERVQERRYQEPIQLTERQKERCRKQRVKVKSAASFIAVIRSIS